MLTNEQREALASAVTYFERSEFTYERVRAHYLRELLASAAPAEGRDASLVRAITDWPGYWIDGQKVTAEDYVAWLLKRLNATEAARLPEPKYYGSQEADGDQHEVKCAYVDGWNACRTAMPATAPTMNEAEHGLRVTRAEIDLIVSDPMWVDHVEISKRALRRWREALDTAIDRAAAKISKDN